MQHIRIIPCLQLMDGSLVKTTKFSNPSYIGDPVNTVRIFNELEVDELCFLDIRATTRKQSPNFPLLEKIANECFMPLSYGGGVTTVDDCKTIFSLGFEKIILNTAAYDRPGLIKDLVTYFGSQAIIGSIDVKKNFLGKHQVYTTNGTRKIPLPPVQWAQQLEESGIGELLVTSIDREGTWQGYDIELIKKIADAVNIPVIANGGAGSLPHLSDAVKQGFASALGIGSLVVYQKKGMGVLVNFPDKRALEALFT